MNYGVLALTFISVNLDFFVMLLFLLRRYRAGAVMTGYVLGTLILLLASYVAGAALHQFLPEWVLGLLGFLPIYLAFRSDDDDDGAHEAANPVWAVLITYLSVCAGCNLSIFLPVLVGKTLTEFMMTALFIGILSALAVLFVRGVGRIAGVRQFLERYGETTMRVCYILIGLYVFWDSGLIHQVLSLI